MNYKLTIFGEDETFKKLSTTRLFDCIDYYVTRNDLRRKVYALTVEEPKEFIYITENILDFMRIIKAFDTKINGKFNSSTHFTFHSFSSFEEAYGFALDFMEPNELCYKEDD